MPTNPETKESQSLIEHITQGPHEGGPDDTHLRGLDLDAHNIGQPLSSGGA